MTGHWHTPMRLHGLLLHCMAPLPPHPNVLGSKPVPLPLPVQVQHPNCMRVRITRGARA